MSSPMPRSPFDMEPWRKTVVLCLLVGAASASPLVNDLSPGAEWPPRNSVKQPSDLPTNLPDEKKTESSIQADSIAIKPPEPSLIAAKPISKAAEPFVKTAEDPVKAKDAAKIAEPVVKSDIPHEKTEEQETQKKELTGLEESTKKKDVISRESDGLKDNNAKSEVPKLPIQEVISEIKNEESNEKAQNEPDYIPEDSVPLIKSVQLAKNDIKKVDYTGAQVWKVPTQKPGSRVVISRLRRRNLISTWGGNQSAVDILVKPNAIVNVTRAFKRENISYDIIIEDLQKRIEEENPPLDENELQLQDRRGHRMTWKQYHMADDIYGFLDYLAKTYPGLITVQTVGKSYEGRDMKVIKISDGKAGNKPVFIDGGIHAREWISPATVTYFINQIAENFDVESEDFKNIDWYFMPLVNPDGYEYTHVTDRLWRKNRRPAGTARVCSGADLNRNFGYRWGGKGASNNPCSEIYRGGRPFSEPESKALSDFIKNSGVKFLAYLSYHSYGQYILYPWGYDNALPPDYEELDKVGKKMAEAIQQTGGSKYSVGSSSGLLYPAAGGSDDWAKAQGIKYAYTIELSDTGRYGFVLPTSFIEPVARESLAALRILAAEINKG